MPGIKAISTKLRAGSQPRNNKKRSRLQCPTPIGARKATYTRNANRILNILHNIEKYAVILKPLSWNIHIPATTPTSIPKRAASAKPRFPALRREAVVISMATVMPAVAANPNAPPCTAASISNLGKVSTKI